MAQEKNKTSLRDATTIYLSKDDAIRLNRLNWLWIHNFEYFGYTTFSSSEIYRKAIRLYEKLLDIKIKKGELKEMTKEEKEEWEKNALPE